MRAGRGSGTFTNGAGGDDTLGPEGGQGTLRERSRPALENPGSPGLVGRRSQLARSRGEPARPGVGDEFSDRKSRTM